MELLLQVTGCQYTDDHFIDETGDGTDLQKVANGQVPLAEIFRPCGNLPTKTQKKLKADICLFPQISVFFWEIFNR